MTFLFVFVFVKALRVLTHIISPAQRLTPLLTPFTKSANCENVATYLIKHAKASLDTADDQGSGIWHALAVSNSASLETYFDLLTPAKGLMRSRNKMGMSPLHVAADTGSDGERFVTEFLNKFGREAVGLDVCVEGKSDTALHLAVKHGSRVASKACVDHDADFDGRGRAPVLFEVLRTGNMDFLSFFLEELMMMGGSEDDDDDDDEGGGGGGVAGIEDEERAFIKEDVLLRLIGCRDFGGESVLFHIVDAIGGGAKVQNGAQEGGTRDDQTVTDKDKGDDGDEDEDEDSEIEADNPTGNARPLRDDLKAAWTSDEVEYLLSLFLEMAVRFHGRKGNLDLCQRRSLDGRTILHLAACLKQLWLVKLLVTSAERAGGAAFRAKFVSILDKNKITAGALAAKTGQTKMSIWLHNASRGG